MSTNEYRANAKAAAYAILGNRCACCGNPDVRQLDIDHIVPVAKTDTSREDPRTLRNRIIADPSLAGTTYQLLCKSCNGLKLHNHSSCDCVAGKLYRAGILNWGQLMAEFVANS